MTGLQEKAKRRSYGVGFNWSPDSRFLAYTTGDEDCRRPAGVFVVPADGTGQPRELTGDGAFFLDVYAKPRWGVDGGAVYCLCRDGVREFAADGSKRGLLTASVAGTVQAWIQPQAGTELWSPDGKALLVVSRDPVTETHAIVRVDREAAEPVVLADFGTESVDRLRIDVAPDGAACYLVTEAANHPPEICKLDFSSRSCRRLVPLSPSLDDVALGSGRLVEWQGRDGTARRGALLLPAGYADGQLVPVIVQVYGGSLDSNLIARFGLGNGTINGQLLASRGYALFCPDLPMHHPERIPELPDLVEPAVDRLIELGVADPDRLGLIGHSRGGYHALALLTQLDCFRAAVCSAGRVNLTSACGIMSRDGHSPDYSGSMGGTLWEKRDTYIENSPLFRFEQVTAAVLLVCGTADAGAAAQAEEAFSALRRLGCRVELREYNGEGHWPFGEWSVDSLRDLYGRVCDWFDAHLGRGDT